MGRMIFLEALTRGTLCIFVGGSTEAKVVMVGENLCANAARSESKQMISHKNHNDHGVGSRIE